MKPKVCHTSGLPFFDEAREFLTPSRPRATVRITWVRFGLRRLRVVEHDGQMTEEEALQLLNVTDRRPKWLLSQVHPDRHPEWRAAAERAAARVNQAMDVRYRHVTEV